MLTGSSTTLGFNKAQDSFPRLRMRIMKLNGMLKAKTKGLGSLWVLAGGSCGHVWRSG